MTTKTRAAAKNPMEVFGAGVRAERKARGYSQEAFADHIGVDRSYMGGVERGERNLSLTNIMRILSGLEMRPSEFFAYLDPLVAMRTK
jgi:transcriptional regulator with XRE-family HTH domain